MSDLLLIDMLIRERQKVVAEDIENIRLAKAMRKGTDKSRRPRLVGRLLFHTGNVLISLGMILKRRYQPKIESCLNPCPPCK
jgi:hypothetical protein